MGNIEKNENEVECPDCNEYYKNDDLHSVEDSDKQVCNNCFDNYVRCVDCNEYYHNDDMQWVEGGVREVCNNCFENYSQCADCNEYYYYENMYEHADDLLCESCHKYRKETATIKDHSYKPCAEFSKLPEEKTSFYFGIELEIETIENLNGIAEKVQEFSDKIYLKEDGSLNDGFEIVSHPFSLNFHKKFAWKEICDYLKSENCKSHNTTTCGLHIHTGKKNYSQIEQIKLGGFIYFFQKEFEIIARRNMDNYAKKLYKINSGKEKKEINNNYDRYVAVNFQNRHTIEFRLFKGTLNYNTLMSSLEIVDAIGNFVKTVNIHEIFKSECFSKFLQFIRISGYEFLPEYLLLLSSKEKFEANRNVEIQKLFEKGVKK